MIWITCGKHYINITIQLKISLLICSFLMKFPCIYEQNTFRAEFRNAINKCSSPFTPDSDYISWNHLKEIVDNAKYTTNIVNIANYYINLGYWLSHFKKLSSIIIPKPNITIIRPWSGSSKRILY